jgi:probable rRNA maturation factor
VADQSSKIQKKGKKAPLSVLLSQAESFAPPDFPKVPLSQKALERLLGLVLKELKGDQKYLYYLQQRGNPQNLELHLCEDIEMRSYQKQFRKLDRTTDVLSFPSLESPENHLEGFMGTLIVSLPTVLRNAKRYKKDFKTELTEVFVHGVLHLLGFDHVKVTLKERQRMRVVQKKIMKIVSGSSQD